MQKIVFYIFVAILIYLFLVYYKGFGSDVGVLGSNVRNLVLNLSGRDNQGHLQNYPQ